MDKKFWANTALCMFLGGCVVFAVTNVSSALTPKGLFRHDSPPCGEAAVLVDKMLVRDSIEPRVNHQVRAEFFVSNTSDRDVENILLQCDFFDENQNFLDREQWQLSGVLKAGESEPYEMTEKRFIHSAEAHHACVVSNLELSEPPMFALHRSSGGHNGGEHTGGDIADHGDEHGHAAH